MSPAKFTYKNLPKNRVIRIILGILLIIGGFFGPVVPVLGIWMIPLGLLFLSVDFAIARRWRRRMEVWWGRKGKFIVENWKRWILGWLGKKKNR